MVNHCKQARVAALATDVPAAAAATAAMADTEEVEEAATVE